VKIAILSRSPKAYSTRRLKEAVQARGHKARVIDTLELSVALNPGAPRLYHKGKELETFDAVVPRIGASITFYGCAVVRQFEQMGVFVANSSHSIGVSRDKLRSLQILSRHEVGLPETFYVRDKGAVLPAIDQLGGAPVIIKLLEGTQGVGVILAETQKVAQAIIETLQSAKQNVLIQHFVQESRGRDIRAFVVGGRVVAAMRRMAKGDEFRSNVHRGGTAERVDLSPEYEKTAVHAAQILGLRVAGVDMLEGESGPQIMEVNSSPGLEGIEGATGIDVAGAVVEHVEDQVLFPEVDVKQRLTLEKGYGVSEFHVTRESELEGKTLREAALRERDVVVLSIQRGSVTIPNPLADRRILQGDVLLCYGKLVTLKSLIPRDGRGRRKRSRKNGVSQPPPPNRA
jgi:ribosomal protein S6--L-glutamate ligase